jgi:hypothetical protein
MSRDLTPSMRRSVLIAALRDPKLWPDGFEWEYGCHGTCAIGLAAKMFGCAMDRESSAALSEAIGVDHLRGHRLFIEGLTTFGTMNVRPEWIADRLEAIHRELESQP